MLNCDDWVNTWIIEVMPPDIYLTTICFTFFRLCAAIQLSISGPLCVEDLSHMRPTYNPIFLSQTSMLSNCMYTPIERLGRTCASHSRNLIATFWHIQWVSLNTTQLVEWWAHFRINVAPNFPVSMMNGGSSCEVVRSAATNRLIPDFSLSTTTPEPTRLIPFGTISLSCVSWKRMNV